MLVQEGFGGYGRGVLSTDRGGQWPGLSIGIALTRGVITKVSAKSAKICN